LRPMLLLNSLAIDTSWSLSRPMISQMVLMNSCDLTDQPNGLPDPNFGIYAIAIQNITQSKSFFDKLFFCIWWGLQNLRCVKEKSFVVYVSDQMWRLTIVFM
jgi:hypothetical protein